MGLSELDVRNHTIRSLLFQVQQRETIRRSGSFLEETALYRAGNAA
jgi:hypothetical protein